MGRRPIEPILWILFSAGGVCAAMIFPILAFLFGVAFPLRWLTPPAYEDMASLLGHPITWLIGVTVCTLSLVHAGHRLRYTLYDGLQIKHLNEVINLVCYGGAAVGSVWAAYAFWQAL